MMYERKALTDEARFLADQIHGRLARHRDDSAALTADLHFLRVICLPLGPWNMHLVVDFS